MRLQADDVTVCGVISPSAAPMTAWADDRAPEAVLEWQELRCYKGGMTNRTSSFTHFSDEQLIAEVKRLAECERQSTADLIRSLMELDARRLYLGEGCSSLFTYCRQVLRLSEHAAYGRIEAARAARRLPVILDLLQEGSITLTTVTLLAPHLTAENHRDVLGSATHKSKRDVELIVAGLRPQPDVAASVRRLPERKGPAEPRATAPPASGVGDPPLAPPISVPVSAPITPPAVVAPLAPERYKIQFTVSRETHDKLRRAQDLLRHAIPNGDPALVFDRALTVLVKHLESTKLAATTRPRKGRSEVTASRHISAAVRREVWSRDEGRCAFVGSEGRCAEKGFLEFHHVVPFAAQGPAVVGNIELRCRSHNAFEARLLFGADMVREIAATWG